MLFCFPCRSLVPQPLWAFASWIGPPSAGHAEELHRNVRLCEQGHDQSATGGPYHQPERSWSRRSKQHFPRSESTFFFSKMFFFTFNKSCAFYSVARSANYLPKPHRVDRRGRIVIVRTPPGSPWWIAVLSHSSVKSSRSRFIFVVLLLVAYRDSVCACA